MINNKEQEKFLLDNGIKDIGGDEQGQMYDGDDITVFLHNQKDTASISFGYSARGYYTIANATFDEIKQLIGLYRRAEYINTD